MPPPYDAIIIGGGFYGLRIALHLRGEVGLRSVLVLEKEPEIMSRASFANQARVHNGYHYPRSMLTGYRSRLNSPRFQAEFSDAITDGFEHYYAIARRLSKTNARQFEIFAERIGAVIGTAPPEIVGWFDKSMVESVYRVREPAFDANILRGLLTNRIDRTGGIQVETGVEAKMVEAGAGGLYVVTDDTAYHGTHVISATYSMLNQLHRRSGMPVVSVQHELAELALIDVGLPWRGSAITVMDGPFFSIMPFPSTGLHTLSHVRYTPHLRWREDPSSSSEVDPDALLRERDPRSNFARMLADVKRYVPGLDGLQHRDSIWEIKTVLTKSAHDDSRPILFSPDHGLPGFTTIMGAKLDNVYDVLEELSLRYA